MKNRSASVLTLYESYSLMSSRHGRSRGTDKSLNPRSSGQPFPTGPDVPKALQDLQLQLTKGRVVHTRKYINDENITLHGVTRSPTSNLSSQTTSPRTASGTQTEAGTSVRSSIETQDTVGDSAPTALTGEPTCNSMPGEEDSAFSFYLTQTVCC
eukprot:7231516-Pyramimonas_sp.AAC.1